MRWRLVIELYLLFIRFFVPRYFVPRYFESTKFIDNREQKPKKHVLIVRKDVFFPSVWFALVEFKMAIHWHRLLTSLVRVLECNTNHELHYYSMLCTVASSVRSIKYLWCCWSTCSQSVDDKHRSPPQRQQKGRSKDTQQQQRKQQNQPTSRDRRIH